MSVASGAIRARKTGEPKLKGPGHGIWAFLILFQFLGALTVNGEAPVSSHQWDFRNCVTGQDVLDTGQDGGKTASPVNVSNGCFGVRGGANLNSNSCFVFSGSYVFR